MQDEIKNIFQYIDAYRGQDMEIGTIMKPFIPNYILGVGVIDEFIKVPRPDSKHDDLGLKVHTLTKREYLCILYCFGTKRARDPQKIHRLKP